LQRVVEGVDLVQRRDLDLVREQHVDVLLDQLEELGAVAVDAEAVRQCERDAVPSVVRDSCRQAECVLGFGLVPQVALEEQHLGATDELVVEIRRTELGGCAEERVERALGVGRHDDQAAAGRLAAIGRRRRAVVNSTPARGCRGRRPRRAGRH
jgi:hypothetical protein